MPALQGSGQTAMLARNRPPFVTADEDVDLGERRREVDRVLLLKAVDVEGGMAQWTLADVRLNREAAGPSPPAPPPPQPSSYILHLVKFAVTPMRSASSCPPATHASMWAMDGCA